MTRDLDDRTDGARVSVTVDLNAAVEVGQRISSAVGKAAAGNAAGSPPPKRENEGGFEYGWCRTDHKKGEFLRKEYRQTDYMNDEPYATRVHAMLDQLGLPKPAAGEVFRGTHHDLLFLDSHGVVIRIGPTDIEDLMNPGILQPLGWLEDRENRIDLCGKPVPLTVAVYPGIELYDHYESIPASQRPPLVGNLIGLLTATKQGSQDVSSTNCGVIRIVGDDGREVAVKMLLDPDNSFNASSQETAARRSNSLHVQTSTAQSVALSNAAAAPNKGEVLLNTLRDVFNAAKDVRYWERAFETHQPLRQMFWDAFKDVKPVTGLPDETSRAAFWSKCASVTNKPEPLMLPVWRTEKTPDGALSFAREEIPVPHLVLYRPWTGTEADRIIKPIQQTPELVAAVARAHHELLSLPVVQQVAASRAVKDAAPKVAAKGIAAIGRRIWQGIAGRH